MSVSMSGNDPALARVSASKGKKLVEDSLLGPAEEDSLAEPTWAGFGPRAAPYSPGKKEGSGKFDPHARTAPIEKNGSGKKAKKQKKSKYDILIPMAQDGLAGRLRDFYGLGPGFAMDQLFTSSDTGNKIYFVSGAVRQLLAADGKGQLHTVHAGVKLFEKNPTKNDIFDFRLRQEGVSFVLPHMTKRVLRLDIVDFEVLLTQRDLDAAVPAVGRVGGVAHGP